MSHSLTERNPVLENPLAPTNQEKTNVSTPSTRPNDKYRSNPPPPPSKDKLPHSWGAVHGQMLGYAREGGGVGDFGQGYN